MPLQRHQLVREFPQFRDRIQHLNRHNQTFHYLAEKYNQIDKQVFEFEQGYQSCEDMYLESLKKKRLYLKDQIFDMLTH